ncbi:hypothetical protein B9Z55_002828 [Caenorhabditis nigoni]|uniref:F-box domain-containing protein n=1 Tax=Caenorhabditis nigoni TaxID=1611254 RepID=A0A2G5VML7_9PELO|nr:hypothetical protein B9Z55_002828 [Caenorhabditis nigoni]
MPFPILRTSLVVLTEIISLLEPNEIVTASLCSKKVRSLFKNHYQRRKPSKWRLSMFAFSSKGCVDIIPRTVNNRKVVMMARHISKLAGAEHKLIEIDGYKITDITFESGFPVLYFQDQVLVNKMIVDYVTDLFSLNIYGLVIDKNGIWAFDWLNSRQEKLLGGMELSKNSNYALNEDKTMDDVLIVRNAPSSDSVSIDFNVSDNARFNGKLGPVDVLLFDSNEHWVTYENLVKFDAIKLFVYGSTLSESDVNSFLRHWRAGGSPRLAFLRLFFKNMYTFIENFDEDLEIVETNEVRRFLVVAVEDVDEIQGNYSIQRWDGVKATICCELGYFTMVVWHTDKN